jgi:hypothetical protein
MKSTKLLVIGAVIVTFIVGLGITSNTDLFKGSLTGRNLNVKNGLKTTKTAEKEYSYYIIESTKGVDVELAKFKGNKFVEDMNKAVKFVDRNYGANIGSFSNTRDAIAEFGSGFVGGAFTRPGMAGVGTGSRDGLINTGISSDKSSISENFGASKTGMQSLGDFNGGMITISGNFGIGGRRSGGSEVTNVDIQFSLINVSETQGGLVETNNNGFRFVMPNISEKEVVGVSASGVRDISQLSSANFRNMIGEGINSVVKPVESNNNPTPTTDEGTGTAKKEPATQPGGTGTAKEESSTQPGGTEAAKKEPATSSGGSQPAKNDGSSQVDQNEKKPSKKDPEKGSSTDDPNSDRGYGNPTGAQLGALSKSNAQAGPSQRIKVDSATEYALRGTANLGAAIGNPGEGSSGTQGNAVIDGAFVLNIDCARSGDLCGDSNADNILIIAIPKNPNSGGVGGNPVKS